MKQDPDAGPDRSGTPVAAASGTTCSARITGTVSYRAAGGAKRIIPRGPCMLEKVDAQLIDIVWGSTGQSSAALPVEEVKAAKEAGNLLLLD